MKLAILKLDEFIDKSFINKTVLRYSSFHLYYNVTSFFMSFKSYECGKEPVMKESNFSPQLKIWLGHQNRN